MEESEDHESDVSDSTVLITDYVDKPEKIDSKRRRLSNLNVRGNGSGEQNENKVPDDVNGNKMTVKLLEKKKSSIDKNWHIERFLACISQNNDTNTQDSDSKNSPSRKFNVKPGTNNSQINQSNSFMGNSSNVNNNDQIISLDSDDETEIQITSHQQAKSSVEILTRNDCAKNPLFLQKPASITTRRATTDIVKRNKMQFNRSVSQTVDENKQVKVKPSTINARRTTIHFEQSILNSNVISNTTSVKNTESEKESKSNGCRSTSKSPKSQSKEASASNQSSTGDGDLASTSAGPSLGSLRKHRNVHNEQNNSMNNNESRQDTSNFSDITALKRLGGNNETQAELKRIKIVTKSTDPTPLSTNKPNVTVQKKMHVTSAKQQGGNAPIESNRINTCIDNNASSTDEVNKKTHVTVDAKSNSTANHVKSDESTTNKYIQNTTLNGNENLEACIIHVSVMSDIGVGQGENKASYLKNKTDAVNEKSTPVAMTSNRVYEKRDSLKRKIIKAASECCDKEPFNIHDAEVTGGSLLQSNQVATKSLNECETKIHDDQGIREVHDKQATNKSQDDIGTRKPHDETYDTKYINTVQSKLDINKTYETDKKIIDPILNQAKPEEKTNNTSENDKVSKVSDTQQKNNVQDTQATNEVNHGCIAQRTNEPTQTLASCKHKMSNVLNEHENNLNLDKPIVDDINDGQETNKVDDQLEIDNVEAGQKPSEALNKETCKAGGKIQENNSFEIQNRQETQKVNNEKKTTKSTNVQEKVTENETSCKVSRYEDENNDRILKFQVGFFTLVKEYLKDIFPESAMELHNLIQTLIIDTKNGLVQTDVKYSCPKCNRVSNYSSRTVDNKENEEKQTNTEGTQKCGFCKGIRKLHNLYMKRFLGKKNCSNDDKEVPKTVSTEKQSSIQDEKSRDISTRHSLININNDAAKKYSVPNEKLSENISQHDIISSSNANNIMICAVNKTNLLVVSTPNFIKASDQLITTDRKIPVPFKSSKIDDEALTKTDPAINNKRKSEGPQKEITENKRVKSITEDNNTQGLKNIRASVSKTDITPDDEIANERPNRVKIIRIQDITCHMTGRLNSSIESKSNDDARVGLATNSESLNENSSNKSCNEKETISEDQVHTKKGLTSENTIDKERLVEVDGNNKETEKASNTTGSIPGTDETNPNQIRNAKLNDKQDDGALKPLIDCFNKIKNCVIEKGATPKSQEENKPSPQPASKKRSTIRSKRSNSLDNLTNRDDRKIVMKYVCPICTSMYVYASKLLRHMQERHNPNLKIIPENCIKLQCPFCIELLSNKNYNKHVKNNHSDKFKQSIEVVENSTHVNKCKKEIRAPVKNKLFPKCKDTENNNAMASKSKDSCITPDKNCISDSVTKQHEPRRYSNQYQHLTRRINIEDINNEEQGLNEDDNHGSIDNGEIIREENNVNIGCEETNKFSIANPASRQNTIKDSNLSSSHNDTYLVESNSSSRETDKTIPKKSNASEEIINNLRDHQEHSRRGISNDKYNESETKNNSHGIINDKSNTNENGDESLIVSSTVENTTPPSNEISIGYDNIGIQSTGNTTIDSSQTSGFNRNKEKESDSESDCIRASNSMVKKRIERITKLFNEENEVLVPSKKNKSKINEDARSETSELILRKKERQIPKHRNTKSERLEDNRKILHRKRNRTEKEYSESAESSDSDWIINNDENPDSCDEIFIPQQQQVVRKLFHCEVETLLQNGRTEDTYYPETRSEHSDFNRSTETGKNNEGSDEETIHSSRYAIKKNKERPIKLFGDDNQPQSKKVTKINDTQVSSEKNGLSNRHCTDVGCNKFATSNRGIEVPSDDEMAGRHFSDDVLKENSDINQQMENSDLNNADCCTSIIENNRTQVLSEEDITERNVERPELRGILTNSENCVNEKSCQEISSKESCSDNDRDGVTDRNDITAVGEEDNISKINGESKIRDDDRIEINMIDRLLKEFAYDDQQNETCVEERNGDGWDVRNSEVTIESQATSESAIAKTCLENIQITNVVSVKSKAHVFLCQDCNYATDVYDDAIRHCQNHFNLIEDEIIYCGICQINYDTNCFEKHQASHDRYLGNIKIKFSYQWLFTNWKLVFEKDISLREAEEMQVKSIYKAFCVKMSVKEHGPWQSALYLCAQCNTCVPVLDIEKHVQEKCTSVNYPCRVCDRVFLTNELRKHHEIYHKDEESQLFKTIVFNDRCDENFNSKLIQVRARSNKQRTLDIFKCLCGLCFMSLKNFKLHFADCDSELNDGRECPKCTRIKFTTTELEKHLLLHNSLVNYEFRLQKITFQQEFINDSSEREPVTLHAIERNLDIQIQTTDLENNAEKYQQDFNIGQINDTVSATSDVAKQMTSIDQDFIIKREMLKGESLSQNTLDGKNTCGENIDSVKEDIRRDLINEMVPETGGVTTDAVSQIRANYEDFNIKRDMLKDEILTQSTYEENSRENPGASEGGSQVIEETKYVVDTESPQEAMEVEQSGQTINIEDSQEINDPITIEASQEMEAEGPEPDHLITIEDSDDDDDVEFIGETSPNMAH